MARYIQKISLRPYSDRDIWAGWDLEQSEGEIEGLILADSIPADDLAKLGVTDFQWVPKEYLGDILPRK